MAISLTEAEAQLSVWLEASRKVAQGLSVTIEGRELTRVDANECRRQIEYWERRVFRLKNPNRKSPRIRFV